MLNFIPSISTNRLETWVFIVAGQSNIIPITEPLGNSNTEVFPSGSLQWGRYSPDNNTLIPTTQPLQHNGSFAGTLYSPGIVTQFAIRMKRKYPYVTLVFIPCGKSGSGFADGTWNKGDADYEDMITRVNTCMSENPDFILKGMIWHQGEDDRNNSGTYQASYFAFIDDWRADITEADTTTPFICGSPCSTAIAGNAGLGVVDGVIRSTPQNKLYTAYADSTVPTDLPDYDGTHFTSDASLEYGDRYFDAYFRALNNI